MGDTAQPGEPVIVFPLQGCGPESTERLRATLRDGGFCPHDWGLGVDHGPSLIGLGRWIRKLEGCVIAVYEQSQRPVTLVGWGLSGIYARELARHARPLVRQVITLGTPFNTAADPLRSCPVLGLLEREPRRLPLAMRHQLRQCPPVPFTSVYSKDDGVVKWQQCVEPDAPHVENIELTGVRHHQLPQHPRTIEVIKHRLAQPHGQWHPFARQATAFA